MKSLIRKIKSIFNLAYKLSDSDFFSDVARYFSENIEGQVFSARELYKKINELYKDQNECEIFSTRILNSNNVILDYGDWFCDLLKSLDATIEKEGYAVLSKLELIAIMIRWYDHFMSEELQFYVCPFDVNSIKLD